MPLQKPPEREMLRLLLACGKLTPDEVGRARKFFDDLAAGRLVRLDHENRVWVERLFYAHKLGQQRSREVAKPTKATSKQLIAAFDAMPRPKKPPGKG
jgi:hypothetical protein